MKTKDILAIKFKSNDLGKQLTIRDYLCELLITMWREGEGFSGKRPFGNSGWKFDLYAALVIGNAVKGSLDEDGYIEDCDYEAADAAIVKCIKYLRKGE